MLTCVAWASAQVDPKRQDACASSATWNELPSVMPLPVIFLKSKVIMSPIVVRNACIPFRSTSSMSFACKHPMLLKARRFNKCRPRCPFSQGSSSCKMCKGCRYYAHHAIKTGTALPGSARQISPALSIPGTSVHDTELRGAGCRRRALHPAMGIGQVLGDPQQQVAPG